MMAEPMSDERLQEIEWLVAKLNGLFPPNATLEIAVDKEKSILSDLLAEVRRLREFAAHDHALVARLLTSGELKWFPWGDGKRGSLGLCGREAVHTELDQFGVPRLTETLRAAIAAAEAKGGGCEA
jgi:hypothetical protein